MAPKIAFRDQGRQRGDFGLVVGLDGIASIALRSWPCVFSRTSENVSHAARSAGMELAASHLPLANCQKSSCGRTAGSIAEVSMPERGSAARIAGAARPIIKADVNFLSIGAEQTSMRCFPIKLAPSATLRAHRCLAHGRDASCPIEPGRESVSVKQPGTKPAQTPGGAAAH